MSPLLWILGIAAAGFFLFRRAAKALLNKQLGGAVSAVQAATYKRLMRRYEPRFDSETAINLAVAVTNRLFGNVSPVEKTVAFKKANAALIERSLRELKDDQDLRIVVTDANRVLAGLKHNTGQQAAALKSFDHLQHLIELGVLLPDRPAPLQRSSFMQLARQYHEQNK